MLSEQTLSTPARAQIRTASPRFDWAMVLLSVWFLGGLFLDGWAHSHGRVDNTFFTPWHAVFYSGYAVVALLLFGGIARGMLAGHAWHDALPSGYELTLIGVPLFALGGVGDMIWHTVFGIESDIGALLSPTHLLLAISMTLILSGPARAAWRNTQMRRMPIPAILSLSFTYALVSFMTQYGHPFVYILARNGYNDTSQALGISAIMLQAGLLSGFVLMALRRWNLPFGTLTFMIGLNAALMNVIEDRTWVIGVGIAAGFVGDVLLAILRPSPARMWAMRVAGAAIPAILFLIYFLMLRWTDRVVWTVHLWTGAVVMAGLVGLGLSLLLCHTDEQSDLMRG